MHINSMHAYYPLICSDSVELSYNGIHQFSLFNRRKPIAPIAIMIEERKRPLQITPLAFTVDSLVAQLLNYSPLNALSSKPSFWFKTKIQRTKFLLFIN
jgi:hypothetical protein